MPPPDPPVITVETDGLARAGFTIAGASRFVKEVTAYGEQLFECTCGIAGPGDRDGDDAEVVANDVRLAAAKVLGRTPRKPRSPWYVLAHVGEYAGAVAAGVGGSNITQVAGQVTVVVGFIATITLVAVRLLRREDG